ncbi:MAG: hypothetical protein JWR26_2072 [Pedosphaera sp.]|nr:hypothetical protein [Pedosphaera sp.]
MDIKPSSTMPQLARRPHRRLRTLFILLGFLVAFITLIWFWPPTAKPRVTLPDGSVVELLGTSVRDELFTTEKPWQVKARSWLPWFFQRWLPAFESGRVHSGSNSISVWVRASAPPSGKPQSWSTVLAEDDAGFCYPVSNSKSESQGALGGTICGLALPSHPRRQPDFLLHFLDTNGVTVGSIRVPNPVKGPFPEWRPLALPQTQTHGPVTLTLSALESHPNDSVPHNVPQCLLTSADPAWANARVSLLNGFLDATGNTGQFLSPREPAWKLRALVYRERPQDFSSSERMSLTNLAIPTPGKFVSIDKTNICAGVALKVLVLAGAGQLVITNGGSRSMSAAAGSGHSVFYSNGYPAAETWNNETPFLLVEARNVMPGDLIDFSLIDENGTDVRARDISPEIQPNGAIVYKTSFIPSDSDYAKSLTLQVIVKRPLQFEFLVNPADIHPPKP